jgi:DNA-binding CsgD family transcriptional regulator
MRGRDRELQLAEDLLLGAERGHAGVLLVEGEPGMGKSGLLAEVVSRATRRNFTLANAEADELGQRTPFAPLLAALRETAGMPSAEAAWLGEPGTWMPAINQIQTQLERRAAASPVLVSLDDLHLADPATLFALRVLPRQLASYPLAWSLARCVGRPRGRVGVLFDLLGRDGAARATLRPLTDEAVADLIADTLGAAPDPGLLRLASGAAGNPLLLIELIEGVRDEGAIQVSQGKACAVSSQVPRRVRAVARRMLGLLSGDASHLLETAAVLGREIRLDDLAEMLSTTPAMILRLVDEAVATGILKAGDESFAFRHELIRCAICEAVPLPARQALHRQFAGILLARGRSAITAADHLLQGTRQADSTVTADLDAVAEQVVSSSPQTAANLALRALELTEAADPARFPRTMRAAGTLAAAARLDEAGTVVRAALAQPQPPASETQLRCVLSSILSQEGQAARARAEAETALARPYLAGPLRDAAVIAQLQALTALGENSRASELAESILAEFGEHGEPALAAALSVLALVHWDDGRLDRGLHLASQAVRRTGGVSPDARHFQPLFAFAARLIDLRRLDEADAVIRSAGDGILVLRPAVSEAIPAILRARISLAMGRTDDAHAEAEAALDIADTLGARPHSSLAHSVLSVIALRKGDIRAAGLHARSRPDVTHYADTYARTESLLARAQFVEAAADPETAVRALGDVYTGLPVHRHVLIGEPTASAWLARTALAAGRPELAAGVARVAYELARDNPAFDVMTVTAAHCGGIVANDPARLARAASSHPDRWARASAAEDLGAALAAATNEDEAVTHLDDALDGYGDCGAARDLARVRRRLRKLGVRRRHWVSAGRPAAGWASLTETELAMAYLVAEGLSNQRAAERMYVTGHTVAFHLRQVFRKLGISSRVELARIVAEHPQGDHGGHADPGRRGISRAPASGQGSGHETATGRQPG